MEDLYQAHDESSRTSNLPDMHGYPLPDKYDDQEYSRLSYLSFPPQSALSSNILLNLPLELRLLVYRQLLVQSRQPVYLMPERELHVARKSSLTILLTCRQIYDEAYQILPRKLLFISWALPTFTNSSD